MKKTKANYLLIFMPLVYMATAVLVVWLVGNNGTYPSGSDTMYHVYRGDFVYNSIKAGNWYPLYDSMWYNGVELLRYWAPLPAYFMAFCQFAAGGSQFGGYLIFVGLVCLCGAIPWFFIGRSMERPYLGAFVGLLWFFMPNNLLAMFVEGNLARSLSMIFLPIFIFAVYKYLSDKCLRYIPLIIISFDLMALCHLGYAGMVALAVIVYCIVYIIQKGSKRAVLNTLISIILSFMIIGVWMVASLRGGITSLDNSENMSNFFQSIWISINPVERLKSGNSNFYFGFATMFIAIFGIFFGYKKTRTGFLTGIIILILTTNSLYPVLKHLPGSQYLWMLRFISIALCMILMSFLMWDSLKKPVVIMFVLLLTADTVPSLLLVTGEHNGQPASERFDTMQDNTLITLAKQITSQRMALMDESSLGASGAWLVSNYDNPVPATFGAGREAANTAVNVMNLNKAMANGNFYYMFDRCLELGNDTVLVRLSSLKGYGDVVGRMDKAAEAAGYKLAGFNSGYRLYHIDIAGNWGTVCEYEAIAIGTGASDITRAFPSATEGESCKLDDYSFDELSQYKTVFLDGFTYDDVDEAEDLVVRLSEKGVKVVIYADGMPMDKKTHSQTFLGVTCSTITFQNGYPDMDTRIGKVYADMFPQEYTTWQTVYLDGLDDVWGTFYDNGLDLSFYGTVKNDNIIISGLNLSYFYSLTNDDTVGKLLEDMTGLESDSLPDRRIVPINIEYGKNSITIKSDRNNVNTSLAYHDIFSSSSHIEKKNNLLYVDRGETVIRMKVPYLWQGIAVSAAGVVLTVVWMIFNYRMKRYAV